jgi:hypothetical protein
MAAIFALLPLGSCPFFLLLYLQVKYHLSSAHVLAKYSHVPSFKHIAHRANATIDALKVDLETQVNTSKNRGKYEGWKNYMAHETEFSHLFYK